MRDQYKPYLKTRLCSAANVQDETKDGKKLSPVRLVSCTGLWENRSRTEGIRVRKLVPGVKSMILDTHLVEISQRGQNSTKYQPCK